MAKFESLNNKQQDQVQQLYSVFVPLAKRIYENNDSLKQREFSFESSCLRFYGKSMVVLFPRYFQFGPKEYSLSFLTVLEEDEKPEGLVDILLSIVQNEKVKKVKNVLKQELETIDNGTKT